MPKQFKSKRGFTIIEVVLVLAIAGLIFMMVFIALPALQRSQRDTQRNSDISRFITQLTQYQSNNRGAIPGTAAGGVTTKYGDGSDSRNGTVANPSNNASKNWVSFYNGYLLAGSDTFEDPSGAPYQLQVVLCNPSNKKAGTDCALAAQRNAANFEEGYVAGTLGNQNTQNYTIAVVVNATCSGEKTVYASGARQVAAVYKREGGGTICQNN